MSEEKNTQLVNQNVIMENRKSLTVTGVKDVDSFDEQTVVAFTILGELTIRGEELHITSLNLDIGEISMQGNIESLTYSDVEPRAGGIFSRIFK